MKILEFSFVLIILACGFLGMDCYQKNQEISRLNTLIEGNFVAMQSAEKALDAAIIGCGIVSEAEVKSWAEKKYQSTK